jgi:hypothetical protein
MQFSPTPAPGYKYPPQHPVPNTYSMCSFLSERLLIKNYGKITLLYSWCFIFQIAGEMRKILNWEWQQAFPEFNLLLIFSYIKFGLVTVVLKYLNFVTSSNNLLGRKSYFNSMIMHYFEFHLNIGNNLWYTRKNQFLRHQDIFQRGAASLGGGRHTIYLNLTFNPFKIMFINLKQIFKFVLLGFGIFHSSL